MTLAVQCPQCLTAFKVVQDQLKVAQGWVKCGRCEQVFDARSHWLPLDEQDPLKPNAPSADGGSVPLHATQFATVPEPVPVPVLAMGVGTISPSAGTHGQPELKDHLGEPVPPRPRRIWAVLIVCLSLALGAQITWWNKSQWLAHWPVAHEWAQSVCAQWRCQLDWPQDLGLVMIERAHFEPDGEGHHRLQIQLTNRANHPVATPWLDLILTDGEDRIVIRRALAPEEMGLPKHLTPGVDAVSSVHWRVDSDVEERLSGYRAEIFYP